MLIMGRPKEWTDADTARLRELHTQGLGRNAIAKAMGKSPGTIGTYSTQLGLAYDRTVTAIAVEARKIDLAERRTRLAEDMLIVAQEALDRCRTEYTLSVLAPGTGQWSDNTVARPPAKELLDLMKVAGLGSMNSLRLADYDRATSGDAQSDRQLILDFADGLNALHRAS